MPLPSIAILDRWPAQVAMIIVHRHDDGRRSYEWQGDPSWPVLVSQYFEETAPPNWLEELPWRLRQIAEIPTQNINVYERLEVANASA